MRIHAVSLPHTQVTKDYISCAYTMKHLNFIKMMLSLDYEVYSYASEDNDIEATENIVINTKEDQYRWFGEFQGFDKLYNITWGINETHWLESNQKAIEEIGKRIQPGDFICLIAGICQKQIADAFPNNPVVEYGIGYSGVFANFKVFESYAHMHAIYGKLGTDDGSYYDAVIPNYFDPSEFKISEKEDYYVFLGRFIRRKGIEIAVEATRQLGVKLIMAGQGCTVNGNTFTGSDITISGDHLEHIGPVNVKERMELLSKAKATFMPTQYLEPFGGVAVESLFCGTPVIASDFGAFTETVPHGIAGYRFRTIGEAAYFASDDMISKLSSEQCRNWADRYSMDNIKYKYDDYFKQIHGLYDGTKTDFYSPLFHGRNNRYC